MTYLASLKILIIGGTRLLGKQLVCDLTKLNHQVHTLSRQPASHLHPALHITGEKYVTLPRLRHTFFDLIVDFTAYRSADIKLVHEILTFKSYCMISSCWIPRLWNSKESLETKDFTCPTNQNLSHLTLDYLTSKLSAEKLIAEYDAYIENTNYFAIRLPIFLAPDDHTKRLDFYLCRFADNKPVIQVNGGTNVVQLASVPSLSLALAKFFNSPTLHNKTFYEACCQETEKSFPDFLKL